MHRAIDWARGYEFLDQELQQIVQDAEFGTRFVDKLLKVWLLDGEETWLLLHIEIQSQMDSGFARRMFVYHYRIFDRYGREVVSLAVLGDDTADWRPQEFGYGRWGCEMRLQFPIIKLLDYAWEDLEASANPFAAVVMAHLKTQNTTQNFSDRLQWKINLIKRLYRRGYNRQDILELFFVIDRMMRLPEPLELVFRDELKRFEEETQMPYVSSFGRIERQEEETLRSFLTSRFGAIDPDLESAIATLKQLPSSEFGAVLLSLATLSREEIQIRFGNKGQ
ncbi:MAG: hypothetical protein MUF49_28290 [Oculatellaceae cyanobacterium Prado106]|nr:hypothetical protein [Oculatellaceae cyanobacterium Prado106]